MTSAINDTFLTSINEAYPIAGVNNSTQGFRDNFARLKEGLGIAGKELTYLQDKYIEVIGDATGVSGILGNSLNQPAPISLVLADTTVTAGTYNSFNNTISLSVDSKGRVTGVTLTPVPTRPGVVGEFKPIATSVTAYSGNVREMTVPALTFDEYGTLTTAVNASATLKFGLEGHVLPKGSLIVGHDVDGAKQFPMPVQSFNPVDVWALAWRPVAGNQFGLQWYKLPAVPPVNPAKVIDITAGVGIHVSTDPAHPTVEFDFTNFPEYPSQLAIQPGSKVLMWDGTTNTEYQIELAKIFTANPTTGDIPLFNIKEDLTPELGGDLYVLGKKVIGDRIAGMTLQTMDAGALVIRNVQTVDPNFYNPNDPNSSVILPENQWIIRDQKFPLRGPTFDANDTAAGITSGTMKIDSTGQMYWDKVGTTASGVQEISPGPGIAFSPIGNITDTGSIGLDFSTAPVLKPDIYSDILVSMDANRTLYKNTISEFTWKLPRVHAVDPAYGSDTPGPGRGQLHQPYRTIAAAIYNFPVGSPVLNQVLLMPGMYEEPTFEINRPNIQLISLMGPETTTVRTNFTIDPDMGFVAIKGINFNLTAISDPAIERIMTAATGIHSLRVDNCWFFRDNTDPEGRLQEIIRLEGVQTNLVRFDNCQFNGIFYNGLVYDTSNLYVAGNVIISNIKNDETNYLSVTTAAGTNTKITNADHIGQVTHNGGVLEMKNIGGVLGDFSDALWDSIDPETDDLESMGYLRDGIVSTANISTANQLILSNVNMGNLQDYNLMVFSKIVKTGTCSYIFSNVDRVPSLDTVNGNRQRYAGASGADIGETVKAVTIAGSQTLRVSESHTWDLTLNANATITFQEDVYNLSSFYPNQYANSLTVLVRQGTGGSNTIQFAVSGGTIIWPDGAGQPATATGVGKVSLYTFIRVGTTWMASRSFNQV